MQKCRDLVDRAIWTNDYVHFRAFEDVALATVRARGSDIEWSAAFAEAYPTVYRALVAVLLDRSAAEDALQEAFAEALAKPPRDDKNLPGWLYRVALRKARRDILHRLRERLSLLRAGSIGRDRVDAVLDRLEVVRYLSILSRRQREVVVAHYYLGLRHAEIAEQLRLSQGTVGATISQALRRMREEANHA